MRPAFLDDMSWAMAEVYGSVTDRILTNIARHFKYIKDGEPLPQGGTFGYQARKLAELGQLNRETVDIIAQSLDGADAALRASLEAAIRDALKGAEPALRSAAEKGLLTGPDMIPPEVSPGQTQAFRTYYRQSADKLNLVNTVMLESTQAAYTATVSDIVNRVQRTQSILNTGAGEVVTGVQSWNEALRGAVRKMADNGLTGFIDHAGRRWSPEAYVAMDIRTTMHNTANAAVWERCEEYGSDIYQVSTHAGARPLCYPWQGKLISRTDNAREVPDIDGSMIHVYAQSETSYGQAAGLFGVNCGHYPIPFIPGFSALRGEPQNEEENAKTYAESQKQRELERKLRKEKLDLAVLKAQGAPEEAIKAQSEKVRAASADIEAFCDETGRTRRKSREYTPVNASFPDKTSYDPTEFPTAQREKINEWFSSGLRNGGESGIIDDRKTRLINADGSEAYRYPKSDVIQKMKSFDEINEYFSTTDRRGEKKYLFSGAARDLPLEHQKALAESVLFMQENFKAKEWPSTIRVQKTATVDGHEVAGYYEPKSRKVVVSINGNRSEGALYSTGVHELIHHFDRYGGEADFCVKQAEREVRHAVNPSTNRVYAYADIQLMRDGIAGDDSNDNNEILAYSIENSLSIDEQKTNLLSRTIYRLFCERNVRQ